MKDLTCLNKLIFIGFLILSFISKGQSIKISDEVKFRQWSAQWVSVPNELRKSDGVFHFRKSFQLDQVSDSFIIHVSADNRYKLYVNGELVSLGPARGDITHWNYETIDIANYLRVGKNVLAAVVWNYGSFIPEAQISYRTGFILQGNTDKEKIVNSGANWKCIRNKGYQFTKPDLGFGTYYVANPGEKIDGNNYPWGWEQSEFDDSGWAAATPILNGLPKGVASWDAGWELVPRSIPQMELKQERFSSVRIAEGIKVPADFLTKAVSFIIPAKTKVKIILDQSHITDAYPVLKFQGGKNSIISLRYQESLYMKEGFSPDRNNPKGNRNEVEGKLFLGYKDELITDGGKHTFIPLSFRVFRYIELTIETQEQDLILEDFYGVFTAYPFVQKSAFQTTENAEFNKILEVGWRTFRLCAQETFIDCPYYEQIQYIGDTRIEALITLYNTTDDRLVRNAIEQFNNSRTSEGITWCRWPANDPQFIPPFSLRWIEMVNDYWMYRGDSAFVKSMLPGVRSILTFFKERQNINGSLEKVPYWTFMDWVNGWQYGIAPADEMGHSSPLDLQLLIAYQVAAQLESAIGDKILAEKYQVEIKKISQTINNNYWDADKKYFADTPDKKHFSQHANVLAVLAGLITGQEAKDLMERVITDVTLAQCSIYFKYYLNQAAIKAGMGDNYVNLLGEWKAQLSRGMTTWAESPEPARSDCHAWGSSPNIEAFRTVLGIKSNAPGFSEVIIEPYLGKLNEVSGSIPHPKGIIAVSYKINKKGKLETSIDLPKGISGMFIWKGVKTNLHEGKQLLKL